MTDPDGDRHPIPALQSRISEYLGRGWTVGSMGEASAMMTRPKPSLRRWLFADNPRQLLSSFRRIWTDEVLLTVGEDGEVHEAVL